MKKSLAALSSLACFLFMPMLVSLVVLLKRNNFLSASTEIPDWIALFLNWRLSAGTFLTSLLIGMCVCALLMGDQAIRLRLGKARTATREWFVFFAGFLKNNFLFWAGNFFAYSLAAWSLDFVEPIAWLPVYAALVLLCAAAIDVFSKKIDDQLFAAGND
ncbi:hypothetical protein PMI22_03824 [Pseudomonas sp. GM21]|uniref:hypothetical protein n=1 Tax=Pseudomonas sp. GM21 TaxID=1144325 RepID=UPI0002726AB6|nr:hypothetical protein [Pseudomonas sp. GM21]EJM16527.1 hypothetical protein PMI22_03824 [Pseudomonas sp. GM21]